MNAEDFAILLKCPKMYELKQLLIDDESRKYNVKKDLLKMLANWVSCQEEWDVISGEVQSFLQTNLKKSWFELHWQKKAAIRDEMFRIRRLYCWLIANMEGHVHANVNLEMKLLKKYGKYHIRSLQIKADLIVEQKNGIILGILLCPQFPKHYRYHAKRAGDIACYPVELLCLMGGMKEKYPDRTIEVMLASLEPKNMKKEALAVFEKEQDNHLIRLTDQEFMDIEEKDIAKTLKDLIEKKHSTNCRSCVFEDICRSSAQIRIKDSAKCADREIKKRGEMKKFKSLPDYTEDQKKAIQHRDGPLRVCAGPGAGKTAVLTARIQDLLIEGYSPDRILAVTFTKKAAREILERIPADKKPTVSTLHALAFQIVRQHEYVIGKCKLVTRVDCMQMLLHVLNKAPIIQGACYEKIGQKNGILDSLFRDFAFINEHGVHCFEEMHPDKDTAGILHIKEMYEQKFISSGYILFDDQIRLGVKILETYSGIRKKVQEAYDYIMVDEAQDLDEMQAQFIRLLVRAPQNNIAIYGDADQSIYGFRGGSNRFMLDFPDIYPKMVDIRLADNFRSSSEILETANTLISHNSDRVPFRMKAHFQEKSRPVFIQKFRANRIGVLIHDLLGMGYRSEQIAIIARTNKELECMCNMLEKYNMEHPEAAVLQFDRPKYYLHQNATFQVILDLLTIYLGYYSDDKTWYRLLSVSEISLHKKDKNKTLYEDYLERGEILPFDGEEKSAYLSVGEKSSTVLQAFTRIYRACSLFSIPLHRAIPCIVESFCGSISNSSQEVIEILDEMIRERNIKTAEELWKYLSAVKKFRDETRLYDPENDGGRIHLLTAHDSKGKEFEAVLVYGIDEFERGDPQEDRRLLYVALTRAKEKLYVTEICKGKSMFLQEFKENLDVMGGIRYA